MPVFIVHENPIKQVMIGAEKLDAIVVRNNIF